MGPHGLSVSTRTQRLARPPLCLVPQAPPTVGGVVPDAIVAFQIASRRAAGLAVVEAELDVEQPATPAEAESLFAGEEPTIREERHALAASVPEPTPEAVMVASPSSPDVGAPPPRAVPPAVPRVSLDDLEDWFTGEI